MMSDVDFFFAEQEAILNSPPESVADYFARRQRQKSRTSPSYTFNPETIPIASFDAIGMLQGFRYAPPASLPPSISTSLNGPQSLPEANAPASGSARDQENPHDRKRKADDAGSPLPGRQHKKSKSIDEQPTPTAAPAETATTPGAVAGISEPPEGPPAETRPHEGRPAELLLPPPAAIVDNARARAAASWGPAGKSAPPASSSVSSADGRTNDQKRPDGVRESKGDSGRRGELPADCSNVTTPPNTAPAPEPKVAAGKDKGPARPWEPARRVAAGRSGGGAAQKQKGKKAKEPRYTPSEYAKVIQAQFAELQQGGRGKPVQFLKGERIYFHGGDLNMAGEATRRRMTLIVKHGGELVPEFDPDRTTHIICEPVAKGSLLDTLKLKKVTDIPGHIPTVKWSWVASGQDRKPIKKKELQQQQGEKGEKGKETDGGAGQASGAPGEEDEYVYPMDWDYEHASFGERIDAGNTPWGQSARMKSEREVMEKKKKKTTTTTTTTTSPAAAGEGSEEISHISAFTQDKASAGDGAKICPNAGLPSPPSSPGYPRPDAPHPLDRPGAHAAEDVSSAGPSARTGARGPQEDPLAEFYAVARAERDAEWLLEVEDADAGRDRDGDGDGWSGDELTSEEENSGGRAGASKGRKGGKENSRFVCDDKDARQRRGACPNQDVITKLEVLRNIYRTKLGKDEIWRVFALSKGIAALRKHPTRIRTEEEAVKIKGIGPRTAQKIAEIVKTGDLRRIAFEKTEDFLVLQLLCGIYNVGPKIARVWYNNGVRTLEDVVQRKGRIKLSLPQKIGLKYYDDINTRIPRAEVQEIYDLVQAEALRLDPELFIRVMGSFRRGKADCGDIDVLITRPTNDGKTHRDILRRLLVVLHKKGVITEDLTLPVDFGHLELVYRGLCRKDAHGRRRRIDFLTVPWTSRGAALLYYTGDDIFNRSMRLKANRMGYSLNQRGLHAGVVRDPADRRKKLHDGKLIASESEEEIFQILGVPWQEPHERIRN